ncbi:MAG TPA: NfeD family protein [Pseudorhodoferax sp.]|nr:NfeD family protein [Pseudorhodoferax sp.]
MADSTFWWLLAGACVVLELVTGTFYLLMLALGFVAAALAAYLGLGMAGQIATAAVVGGGSVALWYAVRSARGRRRSAATDPNLNLDIGETVSVQEWNPDGTASVHYRGARWTAVQRATQAPIPGIYRVVGMVGNRLLVDKA